MKHLLAAALVATMSVAVAPSVAQDKKAEPTKDAPQASTKDDKSKKSEAKAADTSKDAKDPKKKVRKGGC